MKNIKSRISERIYKNLVLYIIFWFAMLVGIICGACLAGSVSDWDVSDINSYINGYLFAAGGQGTIQYGAIFLQSLIQNLQMLILFLIFGFSVLCLPFSVILVVFRSAMVGFSFSYFIAQYGFSGFCMAAFGLLPAALVLFVLLIETAIISSSNSLLNMKMNKYNNKRFIDIKTSSGYLRKYSYMLIFVGVCAILDTFYTPIILGFIFRLS